MDRISSERRSWNMSRIGSKDTLPELAVRSLLHSMGYRFRLHKRDLPGRPDIVLPKFHAVIFVHGCFWHRHKGCRFSCSPKTRKDFWKEKFHQNVQRDQKNVKELHSLHWRVFTVWECQTTDKNALGIRLQKFLAAEK